MTENGSEADGNEKRLRGTERGRGREKRRDKYLPNFWITNTDIKGGNQIESYAIYSPYTDAFYVMEHTLNIYWLLNEQIQPVLKERNNTANQSQFYALLLFYTIGQIPSYFSFFNYQSQRKTSILSINNSVICRTF